MLCHVLRQPAIVEIQILRVGQLVILCVPGELTTMAGRRLREAVQLQVHKERCCHVNLIKWHSCKRFLSSVKNFAGFACLRCLSSTVKPVLWSFSP